MRSITNILCTAPLYLIDLLILAWITISFLDSGNALMAKRQEVKAFLIHKISDVMSFSVLISLLSTAVIIACKIFVDEQTYTKSSWILNGAFQLIYALAIIIIAWILRPSGRSKLLTIGEELQEDRENNIEMVGN